MLRNFLLARTSCISLLASSRVLASASPGVGRSGPGFEGAGVEGAGVGEIDLGGACAEGTGVGETAAGVGRPEGWLVACWSMNSSTTSASSSKLC